MAFNQPNVIKEYTCKTGVFPLISDALKQHSTVTIDQNYFTRHKHHVTMEEYSSAIETPFKEVWITDRPYIPYLPYSSGLRKLIRIIENNWNSDIFHIILHSGGYDSRLLSAIIKDLQGKYGDGWIGDLLFLCLDPEGPYFRKVMECEGWKPNQYFVYNEGVGVDFRAELIDFHTVWKWVNHAYGIPTTPFGPAIEDAKKRGLIPTDKPIHLVTGFLANESGERGRNDFLKRYGAQHILGSTWSPIQHQGIFMPFINHNVPHIDREAELKKHYPELYRIPIYSPQEFRTPPYWVGFDCRLSEETKETNTMLFNESWMATEGKRMPDVGVDPWWRDYVFASLCEELIGNDIKINWSN